MPATGLILQVSAILRGTSYDRFRAWRHIVFEEFGHELSPETGMELSMCQPQVAVRRLCRLLNVPFNTSVEKRLLNRLTEYYFMYLDSEAHEELSRRRENILRYARSNGIRTCLIMPKFEGEAPSEFRSVFDCVCRVNMGENFYQRAAEELGMHPGEVALVVSDADDVDYARVCGIGTLLDAAQFDE